MTVNFLENLDTIRSESKSDELEIKALTKYYAVDVIAKVLFAIDIDSYKERDTTFVRNATSIGGINVIQMTLMFILPRSISIKLGLNHIKIAPLIDLGDHFKKVLKERRASGIKYNDLSEVLQDAVDDEKVKLTEDEVIGNILLAFFGGMEPIANSTTHLFYYLSEYPAVQEKLYNEIVNEFSDEINYEKLTQNEYLDAVVKETLRLAPGFLLITRTATQVGY